MLGFSPALMEVGRYVPGCEGSDLSGCICVCLCGYAVYLSEGREGGEKRKRAMYGYENDELSPATPQFLAGRSFPADTERQTFISIFSISSCVLFTDCDVTCFETAKGSLRHLSGPIFCLLLRARPIHL